MPALYLPQPIRTIGGVLGSVGLALLLAAALVAANEARWLARAAHATGEVVDVVAEAMHDGDGRASGTGYRVVFRFATADGRAVTLRSGIVSSSTDARRGDRVPVDYHPDRPGEAQLAGWADRWLAAAVLAFIGGIFSLVGGLIAFGVRGVFRWRGVRLTGAGEGPPGDLPPPRRR